MEHKVTVTELNFLRDFYNYALDEVDYFEMVDSLYDGNNEKVPKKYREKICKKCTKNIVYETGHWKEICRLCDDREPMCSECATFCKTCSKVSCPIHKCSPLKCV